MTTRLGRNPFESRVIAPKSQPLVNAPETSGVLPEALRKSLIERPIHYTFWGRKALLAGREVVRALAPRQARTDF